MIPIQFLYQYVDQQNLIQKANLKKLYNYHYLSNIKCWVVNLTKPVKVVTTISGIPKLLIAPPWIEVILSEQL